MKVYVRLGIIPHVERSPWGIVRSLAKAAQSERITFLAASIAYYAIVSIIPIMLILLITMSVINRGDLAAKIVTRLGDFLTPAGEKKLEQQIIEFTKKQKLQQWGLTSILALTWTGLRIFRGLDVAFAFIYRDEVTVTLLDQFRDAIVVVIGLFSSLSVIVILGTLINRTPSRGTIMFSLVLIASLTMSFLPMYYVFPNHDTSIKEALPGAILAAIGWTLLTNLFSIYLDVAGNPIYNIFSGALVLVTEFYFGAIILLLGVALNALLTGHIHTDKVDEELDEQSLPEHKS
jgi:membrane protein